MEGLLRKFVAEGLVEELNKEEYSSVFQHQDRDYQFHALFFYRLPRFPKNRPTNTKRDKIPLVPLKIAKDLLQFLRKREFESLYELQLQDSPSLAQG